MNKATVRAITTKATEKVVPEFFDIEMNYERGLIGYSDALELINEVVRQTSVHFRNEYFKGMLTIQEKELVMCIVNREACKSLMDITRTEIKDIKSDKRYES